MPRQLPLNLDHSNPRDLENFLVHRANRELLQLLRGIASGESGHSIHIYGPAGEGRSHLLQATCRMADQHGISAFYLGLRELGPDSLALALEGLEQGHFLCLDDLEIVAGNPAAEQALFHFLNRDRLSGRLLLSSAMHPVSAVNFVLRDLASRLQLSLGYRLHPLTEAQRRELLTMRAREWNIYLCEEVLDFVLRRAERSSGALLRLLERLRDASLAEGRMITVPFVKKLFAW